MYPFDFPATSSLLFLAKVLVVSLAIFHVIFLLVFRLGKVGWKVIDYVWLTTTVLALMAGAAQVRMIAAEGRIGLARFRSDSFYHAFRSLLEQQAGPNSYFCTRFVRSEYSPPPEKFDASQAEFNSVCSWVQSARDITPSTPPQSTFDVSRWPPRPPVTDDSLNEVLDGIFKQCSLYNEAVQDAEKLETSRKRRDWELELIVAGPFLLAVALALRITKVTGEIVIDVRGKRAVTSVPVVSVSQIVDPKQSP